MPGPTMTAEELAAELGREPAWIYRHWRDEVVARRLPKPLHNGTKPLAWSRAQVYAVIDKELTAGQRAIAAAFRAAAAAAAGASLTGGQERIEAEHRNRLDAIYAGEASR